MFCGSDEWAGYSYMLGCCFTWIGDRQQITFKFLNRMCQLSFKGVGGQDKSVKSK